MTKTLTEQWREGTLPLGTYYIVNINGNEEIDRSVAIGELWNNTDLKEVLAPVPSYSEYQALKDNCEFTHTRLKGTHQKITHLEKKLEIATKALKEFKKREDNYLDFGLTPSGKEVKLNPNRVATKALKEMEGVK